MNSFEQTVRKEIAASPIQSEKRRLFKVLLGEIQRGSAAKPLTEEQCIGVAKKMIAANQEFIECLPEGDSRREGLEDEIALLRTLLPQYWTADQIRQCLEGIDLRAFSNDGQAIGKAMQYLKSMNAFVEGSTVKDVVNAIRKS